MISVLQGLVLVFALFAISRAYLRLREGKLNMKQFGFWIVLWSAVVALAMNPDLANYFSEAVGVQRPIDAIVYSSIVLLFYLIFRLYVLISGMEKQITKIVSKIARK